MLPSSKIINNINFKSKGQLNDLGARGPQRRAGADIKHASLAAETLKGEDTGE